MSQSTGCLPVVAVVRSPGRASDCGSEGCGFNPRRSPPEGESQRNRSSNRRADFLAAARNLGLSDIAAERLHRRICQLRDGAVSGELSVTQALRLCETAVRAAIGGVQ
jgi:hypothetical protein